MRPSPSRACSWFVEVGERCLSLLRYQRTPAADASLEMEAADVSRPLISSTAENSHRAPSQGDFDIIFNLDPVRQSFCVKVTGNVTDMIPTV